MVNGDGIPAGEDNRGVAKGDGIPDGGMRTSDVGSKAGDDSTDDDEMMGVVSMIGERKAGFFLGCMGDRIGVGSVLVGVAITGERKAGSFLGWTGERAIVSVRGLNPAPLRSRL
jgi:hypothetical protein